MSNQADAVPITSALFPFRLSEEKKKKKKKETRKRKRKKGERKRLKSIPRRCIGTIVCPPSFEDSRSRRGRDSRAEFLTTARILSLAGQLVAGISRERIDFSSHRPSRPRCVSIPIHPPTPFVASFSPRPPQPFFSSCAAASHLTPPIFSANAFGSDLFLRSAPQRNPSSSFILAQDLSDLPFFISSSENPTGAQGAGLRRFRGFWRTRL